MNNPLTSVEALRRAIEKQAKWLKHLESMRPVHNSEQIRDQRQMLAALELALADAELAAANDRGEFIGMDAGLFLYQQVIDARAKLYETLKL